MGELFLWGQNGVAFAVACASLPCQISAAGKFSKWGLAQEARTISAIAVAAGMAVINAKVRARTTKIFFMEDLPSGQVPISHFPVCQDRPRASVTTVTFGRFFLGLI